jgi:hypothetical protein
MKATVDFAGELVVVEDGGAIVIGREGDLEIDDNPYLHRHFLEVAVTDDLCWLTNLGSLLSATVSDAAGRVQAWLSPGARLPIVFDRSFVRFTAGPTAYALIIELDQPTFDETRFVHAEPEPKSETTIGLISLTPDQKLLILSLAEPVLSQEGMGAAALPASAEAARRLGWSQTKFTRKLDNVSEKVAKPGVRGLHGGTGQLATNRRARLVEYAISVGLVTERDLWLLDRDEGSDESP